MTLEKYLQAIAEDGTPVSYATLIGLSNLSQDEMGKFARVWARVPPVRKHRVIDRLVLMAEDNAELEFSAIFKVCLKDPDEKVREKGIIGLWEFEDRSLILTLVDLLKSDDSGQVRAAAAVALGKFASLAQDGKILSRDGDLVKASLMRVLRQDGEHSQVRRRALESAAPYNTAEINEFIRRAYDGDDIEQKCSAVYAMGKTGEPSWLPRIVNELRSNKPPLRYEAAVACGEIDEESAAPYLIPLLHDDDFQVQLATIGALGKIANLLAKRALKRCLKKGDPSLEDAIREALENIQAMEDPLAFSYEQ